MPTVSGTSVSSPGNHSDHNQESAGSNEVPRAELGYCPSTHTLKEVVDVLRGLLNPRKSRSRRDEEVKRSFLALMVTSRERTVTRAQTDHRQWIERSHQAPTGMSEQRTAHAQALMDMRSSRRLYAGSSPIRGRKCSGDYHVDHTGA